MPRSSSPDIVPISPPPPPAASSSTRKLTLPKRNLLPSPTSGRRFPKIFRDGPKGGRFKDKARMKAKEDRLKKRKEEFFVGKGKEKVAETIEVDKEDEGEGEVLEEVSRARTTEKMMNSLGKSGNPITNSSMPQRSDYVASCATGHQRGEARGPVVNKTYAQVRTDQLQKQSRANKTMLFKGCLFYMNGSTGPKVSNLQLRNMIAENGGRFTTVQTSACTHIIANAGLSGGKTQKHLDMQGGRRSSRQARVVRVEWVLDSVAQGAKLSEAGYTMIDNPTQPNLFTTLGVKPKSLQSE
ncbi:hypothetical protein L202_01404 [Cryptococcus amylolentus CBS 6039]|uniref:BRCT domain-containing protein n=2 Tax=Cryptococcus amylolentus TaxID=104669 RepID=A0A1E3I3I2_9TREE|nr:hypothetical protein L202_01404 [Cryptococcus amylolentus CBS 6039]ODN83220.1 hypothetical protein L202_01404 [Cryptococcus amylolentus CBS 6039]ODO10793.1 hypothetical protein I350_01391 [Cryptococcus amylolentus CBS 6273]